MKRTTDTRPTQFLPMPRPVGWLVTAVMVAAALYAAQVLFAEQNGAILFVVFTLIAALFVRPRFEYLCQQLLVGWAAWILICTDRSWEAWQYPMHQALIILPMAVLALRWRSLTRRRWVGALGGLAVCIGLLFLMAPYPRFGGVTAIAFVAIFCLVYGAFFIEVDAREQHATERPSQDSNQAAS
ncbi:MAG: hypothetical protein K1X74_13380 [Pirellulales bacterium]|nr:hypothetical protein [Pirellulales bacterium]